MLDWTWAVEEEKKSSAQNLEHLEVFCMRSSERLLYEYQQSSHIISDDLRVFALTKTSYSQSNQEELFFFVVVVFFSALYWLFTQASK